MYADRQPSLVPVERDGHGWLPGGIGQGGESGELESAVGEGVEHLADGGRVRQRTERGEDRELGGLRQEGADLRRRRSQRRSEEEVEFSKKRATARPVIRRSWTATASSSARKTRPACASIQVPGSKSLARGFFGELRETRSISAAVSALTSVNQARLTRWRSTGGLASSTTWPSLSQTLAASCAAAAQSECTELPRSESAVKAMRSVAGSRFASSR